MADSNFNLLEWYAAHRGEVGLLRDPAALFALGLLDNVGETPRGEFQQDLGVDATRLDQTIDELYAAGFVTTQGTTLAITPQGKQFLTEIGLRGPLPPPSGTESTPETPTPPTLLPVRPPGKPPPPASRTPFWLWGLIGLLIVGILLVFWVWNGFPGTTPATRVAERVTGTPTRTPDVPTAVPRTRTQTRTSPITPTPTRLVAASTNYIWTIVGSSPPFDNLRLQNALAHAVDGAVISKAVLQGNGAFRNADPRLDQLDYDVTRANELKTQAKYTGQPVFIVPKQDRTSVELANYLSKYLGGAGFDARVVDVESRATILVGPEP